MSEKIIKAVCPGCQGELEIPEELAGELVECTECGTTLTAPSAIKKPGKRRIVIGKTQMQMPSSAPSEPDPEPARLPPKGQLASIRKHTCYPFFRTVVNIMFGLWVLLIVVGFAGVLMQGGGFVPVLLGLLGCSVGFVLVMAGRESMLMLADIADCQVQNKS